jgi:hypothetical protein
MEMRKNDFGSILPLLLFTLIACVVSPAIAQPQGIEIPRTDYMQGKHDITLRKKDNFWEMEHFGDVFHSRRFMLGQNRVSGNISYNWGRVMLRDTTGYYPVYRNAVGFFTRIRFYEEFSLNTTFYKNFEKRADVPWIGDFSYSIGRFTWRPNKFNYGYENYVNNKYNDSWQELGRKFLEGSYFVTYSHFLPEKVMDKIRLDSTSNVRITYFAKYALRYRDDNQVQRGEWYNGKPIVGAGVRYTVFWNIYVEGSALLYANPLHKQPWDPDFTYGFGYFDWRSFRASLTYGNWAVNRFPWNEKEYPYYGFLDGQFKFGINYIW